MDNNYLISASLFLPSLGVLTQILIPSEREKLVKWLALGASFLSSALIWFLLVRASLFSGQGEMLETLSWVGSYNITYTVGIDGLNAAMLLLLSAAFPVLVLFEWGVQHGLRGRLSLLLLLQSAFLGASLSQDLFLMVFFLAIASVPTYFLLAIWGGEERERGAFRLMVASSVSNGLIFGAMILIYFSAQTPTFFLPDLIDGVFYHSHLNLQGIRFSLSDTAFLFLSLGLGLRLPIWPLHGWCLRAIKQGPTSVMVLLTGLTAVIHIYLFIKLGLTLFPEQLREYHTVVITFGVLNLVFGLAGTVSARELPGFAGHFSMAQIGIILLGVGSLDSAGVVGSLYHSLAYGIGMVGLSLFIGTLEQRLGHLDLYDPQGKRVVGGMITQLPALGVLAGVIFVSLVGVPGLGGFVGHSLILMGGYQISEVMLLFLSLVLVALAGGLFWVFKTIFLGEPRSDLAISDVNVRERFYMAPILMVLLFIGIYPKALLDMMRPAVNGLINGMMGL